MMNKTIDEEVEIVIGIHQTYAVSISKLLEELKDR